VTERGLPIADGAPACPFVAFEDDRDERGTSPDHRHRCYAEAEPAPRALAHQEAYCLSSAFPVCPTFQDWARREAARSRADGPRTSESAGSGATGAQRNPPRNWAAPPPWSSRHGGPDAPGGLWADEEAEGEDAEARAGRGLSGSFADRLTSEGAGAGAEAAALAGPSRDEGFLDDAAAHEMPPASPVAAPDEVERASRGRDREQLPARGPVTPVDRSHARRRDPDAPEWEHGRPMEVYPTLRARRLPELSVPPLLVGVIAVALAAAVLFALPGLLGFGGPSSVASPTPTARPTSLATLAPTPVPQPTQQIYIVQSGDTMSKIAKRFGVPLGDLIAANADNIPNPDVLKIGDEVIIPVPTPSEIPALTEPPAS
jgi:hypothetical protein